MLQIADLEVHYGTHPALLGVSLVVGRGQVVGLLGRNGAGKSTLVNAVAGLVKPSRGSILVGGLDVRGNARATSAMMGVSPQELAIYPPLTVTENLVGWAALAGVGGRQRRLAVREVLEAMGLDRLADRPAHLLSGGEQRRLHCAMAMVGRPPLLMLDEPTVGVDPPSRRALLDYVGTLASAGTAVLYSTHYLTEIEQLGAYTVILHRGRVAACGDIDSLVRDFSGTTVEIAFSDGSPPSVRIPVADPDGELPGIIAGLHGQGRALAGITVHRSSLEDVFFRVTAEKELVRG
ncbi:ABC transporter ATP-binding protein [Rhizocola hellebori]|uniref:ABC transporter ATP-binding protein n=1 Tax=Rhizocola hellebori TaxID=1392758 RepID=A0A8J3Q7L1_9ACTN|nr:ABC transporter ATP-binding protein [Rhizocola hellebori]GIH04909.1 ABC transporter ATP-binding protein [Rhizocola hellebori]